MKKKDVKVGERYVAKVSGKLTTVKILRESVHGGWDAENTETGRSIRVRTAGRLRGPAFNNDQFAARLSAACVAEEDSIRRMFQEAPKPTSDTVAPKSLKDLFKI